jgi:hypothetical protein
VKVKPKPELKPDTARGLHHGVSGISEAAAETGHCVLFGRGLERRFHGNLKVYRGQAKSLMV